MLKVNGKICVPTCEYCGEPMTFERTTPKSALMPELQTFICADCGDAETVEITEEEAI